MWNIPFRVVRLWEREAQDALASGLPGLAVLSPLMRGATAAVVEQAASVVLEQAGPGQQADLLTILGIFGEPLLATEQFVGMVGRERLMSSDLISYLVRERIDELEREHAIRLEQERATLEEERAAREQDLAALMGMVEDAVIARFPAAPLTLAAAIRQVRDPQRLRALHAAVLQAPDQATVERLLLAN